MNRRERLAAASLYLCTDARRERGDLLEFVGAALDGGVDIVQLRDKGSAGEREFGALEAGPELEILAQLKVLTERAGALLAVNDRADIAVAADADVLHVGQDDLPAATARRLIGEDVVLGLSTHDDAQVAAAAADPLIDYFCVGPCWSTPTKPGRPGTGLDLVRHAASLTTDHPWFAIGGIDLARAPEAVAAGARRIVVVRAITGADDPRAAAAALRAVTLTAGGQSSV
ncbi:thiamine phosphate synthase [Gordonia crocea]|uniref:Thiamine-phosphate synthase n=1 Tax=Gordonia crocea TaxID=589162 RepID=A0A7M3SVE9_9ACTN|nr:thiamine phosphate synthase [Gordonia crocea]GED96623.1 thiamine-phosphate synthase [Gordonia crocea]